MSIFVSFAIRSVTKKLLMIVLAVVTIFTLFGIGIYFRQTAAYVTGDDVAAPTGPGALSLSYYIYGELGDNALNKPMHAAFGNGRVYVSDAENERVQVFAEDGKPLFKFGTRGSAQGEFFSPYGIVVGSNGNVYVADLQRNDIQVFTKDGQFVSYFAEKTQAEQYLATPGMMHLAGNKLYVANIDGNNILVFDIETEELLQTVGILGDLRFPNAVTVDDNGYIYVVDSGNDRIVVYNPEGNRIARVINGSADGRGQTVLSNPRGIALRSEYIYVVSNLTNNVYVFDKKGAVVSSFGGQGAGQNQFMLPNGMSIDQSGRILITDTLSGRIAVYR